MAVGRWVYTTQQIAAHIVGKKLEDATTAFSNARNRLQDSRNSAISRARRLAELGSKAKKALPPELQPEVVQQLAGPDEE